MICARCNTPNSDEQRFCGQCGAALSEACDGFDALDRINQVLDGRYRLINLVGIGGSGAVYRAEVEGVGHSVAIKILHPSMSVDKQARSRLENEARLASQIDHPNIVSILDMRSAPELTYLVMEFLSGISLAEVMGEVGHLGVRRTIHIMRQVLSALEASHDVGVLHRDLKPENIFLTLRHDHLDFVKILDFGMATLAHRPRSRRITLDGHVCGTPGYMAPEQVRNRGLTPQSDLYAVGVLLYEALTGVNPYITDNVADTLVRQITHDPQPPSEVCKAAEIPPYLDALVLRALRKDPAERFRSAQEFRWVLEGLALAHKRQADAPSRLGQSCAGCGRQLPDAATWCDACGQPVPSHPLAARDAQQVLSPDLMNALDASTTAEHEFDLSPTTTITGYHGVGWDPPLVGRGSELERIHRLLEPDSGDDAVEGWQLLRIVGVPGAGKGRLAREAAKLAHAADWQVHWCEPDLHPVYASLHPIQQLAAQLLGLPRPTPDEAKLLNAARRAEFAARHVDGLRELFGFGEPTGGEPAAMRRARRARAWHHLVRRAADRDGPLLLLFHDVHDLDQPSQDLVTTLGAAARVDNPVRVIATHDPDLLLLWPETEILTVPALSSTEARQLAQQLFAHLELDGDAARIASASGGNPLLLIEQIRLLALDPSFRISRELAEVISQRVSRLPPRSRALLHTISVLGRPTRAETLVSMLDDDQAAEQRALQLLAEQGFIFGGTRGWRLAHRLHREVAYASIPVGVRDALHSKAAELAIDEDAPPALIAHHLYSAGLRDRALSFMLEAGKRALHALDDQRAADLFRRALQLMPPPPRESEGRRHSWINATVGLAQALRDSGDATAARRVLRQARAVAEDAGWTREQRRCDRALSELGTVEGSLEATSPDGWQDIQTVRTPRDR